MKRRTGYFKSLRFRIMVILVLLGIIPSVLALHIVISSYEEKAIEVRSEEIRKECRIIASMLVRQEFIEPLGEEEESGEDPDAAAADLARARKETAGRLELLANVYRGRILVVDRDYKVVADTYGLEEGEVLLSPLLFQSMRGEEAFQYDPAEESVRIAVQVKSPLSETSQGGMLVLVSAKEVAETIKALQQREIVIIAILVVVVLLLAYFLSTALVKPLARVTKSIEDLTDGYQDGEISVPDYTETELITDAFNKLLARMKILDDSRNEFVSNVSHELKTPMTSMKVLADSLVGQSGVPEELYQDFMRDITKEIDRENKIITDLLTLVKMDKRAADMKITHVNINALVEGVLRRLRPIAKKRNIDLILDSFRVVDADVDEGKFTSALSNLVENGIKYNVDDGWVRVTLDADHQYVFLTVSDSGLGIPEASIGKIFERFYRVDKSHSKEIGGTGLGLAITRSAITAHHGTITVKSVEGEGSSFHVRLPLTYIP